MIIIPEPPDATRRRRFLRRSLSTLAALFLLTLPLSHLLLILLGDVIGLPDTISLVATLAVVYMAWRAAFQWVPVLRYRTIVEAMR